MWFTSRKAKQQLQGMELQEKEEEKEEKHIEKILTTIEFKKKNITDTFFSQKSNTQQLLYHKLICKFCN